MGGTISITIRECARIDRVRELYHNKKMMKDLFNAIREHGTEVENIAHQLSPSGSTLFLADVICYITKRVDPFMNNFFSQDLLSLDSNALSQIVTAAFDFAVKLDGSLKRKQSFVKTEQLNHKFAELRLRYFPGFIAALLYFDHLWELFDIADDNIDDDCIFLGEFMRAKSKIEEIDNVKFLREVSDESWKKEFYKIDNGDEQDGWISFLEFARYAAAKIKSPEDYINNRERILKPVEEKKPKKKQSKAIKPVPIEMVPVGEEIAFEDTIESTNTDPIEDGKPKSMMKRFNERLNASNRAADNSGRKMSVFKVKPEERPPDDEFVEGTKEYFEASLRKGRETVMANRNAAFLARLKRDEDQIVVESEAAENMPVSLELSQELVDMRTRNAKMGDRPLGVYNFLDTKEKNQSRKAKTVPTVVGPFTFSGIPIHHVKPNSYAAQCEERRLLELETLGKPLNHKENNFVDTRPFSINNLNKVMKILKKRMDEELAQMKDDSIDDSIPVPEMKKLDPLLTNSPPESEARKHREADRTKAKFRQKIDDYIAEGQAVNHKHQDRPRPKSASIIVTKTSRDEFDKNSSSPVQAFFNSYTDVDKKALKKVAPPTVKSLQHKYDLGSKSESLALSSKSGSANDYSIAGHSGSEKNKLSNAPYIDDVAAAPHLARGKVFTDSGNHDKRRFGNVRFGCNSNPRVGHFPSKHDTLQGQQQYDLWDSKRNKSLAAKKNGQQPIISPIKSKYPGVRDYA